MELSIIIPHIEALIFAADRPLTTLELTDMVNNALGFIEDRASLDQTEAAIEAIREKYASEFYPFEVRETGGGWQFLTKRDYYKTVAQINGDKFLKRLSTATLETLAIIAYKQPITKGEIESIRGVNCDYTVQKLLEKELVVITGRNEKMPGQPLVYATSRTFMDYFGINSTDDLPRIKEIISQELVNPTGVQSDELHVPGEDDDTVTETLVVKEDGSLVQQESIAETEINSAVEETETINDGAAEAELTSTEEAGEEDAPIDADENNASTEADEQQP
ncbi:MAG: SMC-Scp complex subunit ScpB [Chitinophagaceae bacterium]|nr:SMC-Scp complex subunit ScpB [Chitinophagaceae bacterium]